MASNSPPRLNCFLSSHNSIENVVDIAIEPNPVFFEEARNSLELNFDFIIKGLTDRKLTIRFIKAAVYDNKENLVTFRHLNHNGVGTPSIFTIGRYELDGKETLDLFNPFHSFPLNVPFSKLRYMFTFYDHESKEEYYYGNIVVMPSMYEQETGLAIPLKGKIVVLDGHDFYSHHRRFAMSLVRTITNGKFIENFSRYGVDFTLLGDDGNTRSITSTNADKNYDFHFDDARAFYTDGAIVYAPADGEIVEIVSNLEDLYEVPFNMDSAIREDRIKEIAGNYIIIKHSEKEYSHLFHLLKDSSEVVKGETVKQGQPLARIGFSGAATTYSHLHYQLMDGKDFLRANPLPCKFSDVTLLLGAEKKYYSELSVDTGDFIISS